MIKPRNPDRTQVQLRPSRIRREPPPPPAAPKALRIYSTERETWTVIVGVILFSLAIGIIVIAISELTSR